MDPGFLLPLVQRGVLRVSSEAQLGLHRRKPRGRPRDLRRGRGLLRYVFSPSGLAIWLTVSSTACLTHTGASGNDFLECDF